MRILVLQDTVIETLGVVRAGTVIDMDTAQAYYLIYLNLARLHDGKEEAIANRPSRTAECPRVKKKE